ncbi:MAG: phosphoribosylpyrophosphate synthetase [Bacteroidetes bacterium]|nr:MAG: phosphoribosylpyrophosphate synthetase [Bacteroidota bacterium]
MEHPYYQTLSQAVEALQEKGFTSAFKLEGDHLLSLLNGLRYSPADLRIVGQYRFEGESNPADLAVVFAVEAQDGLRGMVVSSYGTYADIPLITFMEAVPVAPPGQVLA